jgi:LPXTG-site transpeptidase (sortase) family protein
MRVSRVGLIVGAAVVIIGGMGFVRWNRPVRPPAPKGQHSVSPAQVSETPITNTYYWSGTPDEPRYITLPSIAAEGFVQKVGLQQQQIAAPSNIHLAGWYAGSQKPGQPGLSVIDGHVDGRQQPGIFQRLAELKLGAEFTLQTGSENVLRYQVISTRTVKVAEALNQLFSQDAHTVSQLNLITCSGTFNAQSRQYDKRTIVAARLVSE